MRYNGWITIFKCWMSDFDTPKLTHKQLALIFRISVFFCYLLNHVTFWMPVFNYIVSFNFHVLFKDWHIAADTWHCKTSWIMKMTINFRIVLVIRVFRAKNSGAVAASEMVCMVLFIEGNDVCSSQWLFAFCANESQSFKIIFFT